MKTVKSKKKGINSDITQNKRDNEMAVRDLQIDIPDEMLLWSMLRPTKMADIMIIYMWKHPWIHKIGQYRKISPPQSLKKRTLRTVLLKSWMLLMCMSMLQWWRTQRYMMIIKVLTCSNSFCRCNSPTTSKQI